MDTNIMKTMAARKPQLLTLSGDTDSTVIDMKDFNGLLVSITPGVITGDVTKFNILAYSDAAGTADETLIKTGDAFPTAVNDVAFLEISDAEIAQKGSDNDIDNLRYCRIRVAGTDTDLIVLNVEQGRPHFCYDGLTADVITA